MDETVLIIKFLLISLGLLMISHGQAQPQNRHDFSRIHSASQLEGWVKSAYLTQMPPAIVQLKESINNNKKLQLVIDQLCEKVARQAGTINNNAPQLEQSRQQNSE